MSGGPGRRPGAGPTALPLAALTLAGLSLVAAAVHAAPALTGRDPLRRLVPSLAGAGAPGGIALTFDDGPDPEGTPAVLGALDALGWTATFFLLGTQVERHPALARALVAAGHEVAVHGHRHRNHLWRGPLDLRADLLRARDTVAAATGVRPRWFRPPYGVLSAGSLVAARAAGLTPVLWTAWGRDWVPTTPEAVTTTVLRDLRDGGTVLLHDSDCTSTPGSWRTTAAALPLLAERLRERAWAVRTLSEHVSEHSRGSGRRGPVAGRATR